MTTHIDSIAIMVPLAAGLGASVGTIVVHALALNGIIQFVRRERRLGRTGERFWLNVVVVGVAVVIALGAHLVEIGLWAILFMICGEFRVFATAFYHSAVNYTSLGYGDIVMSSRWRFLGPLEAADGMLMFGVSTAMIFTVIQRLVEARFADLRA
jgi:hypothetical protein